MTARGKTIGAEVRPMELIGVVFGGGDGDRDDHQGDRNKAGQESSHPC